MSQARDRLSWILGAALVVALIVIAFLLGRESKPPATSGPAPVIEEQHRDDGAAAEVAAYFSAIDRIQAGPTGMSADMFAQQLMGDASTGKTAGFDQLQTDLDRVERELRAISPPAPCKDLHELTLSAASDAKALMNDLRGVLSGGGGDAQRMLARAQAAEAKTKQIEEARAAIERRYGTSR